MMQKMLSRKITVFLSVLAVFGFFYFCREDAFRQYVTSAGVAKKAGDESAALKNFIFADALDEKNSDAEISIKRAEIFWGHNDYVSAERELTKALEASTENAALYGWMGRIKCAEGNYSDAEESFARSFEIDPTAELSMDRAKNLVRSGKFAEAEKILKEAQQKFSSEDIAYYLGLIKSNEGKFAEADFEDIKQGKYKSQIVMISEYFKSEGSGARADSLYVLVSRADLFQKIGEKELVLANLDIVLYRNNKYRDAYLILGKTFAANGDYDGAREAFEKCLALDVNNAEVYFYLGNTYEAMNNLEKAKEYKAKYENLLK